MARSMSQTELFMAIKSMLTMKYRVMFAASDKAWSNTEKYSNDALIDVYLGLMEDRWKEHNITSHKAFFAEHLKRMSI